MSEMAPDPGAIDPAPDPVHTFGGRALDRYILDFETDLGGGDPGALGPGDPAPDPAPDASEAPWAPSQDEWNQIAGAVGYLAELEQQRAQVYQPQQPGGEQPVEIDPFDPQSIAEHVRQLVRAETAPLQQLHQQMTTDEGEERARDILTDDATANGEFDIEMARLRADRLLPQMNARMGRGTKAAEAALAQAAKDQRDYEAKRDQAAVERHMNQLKVLDGAPGEAGSTYAQGVQQRVMPDYREGGTVASRFFGGNAER